MPKNDEGEFELVLGNRQLISVFLIVVILLGVFFSMGYIVGRNSSPAERIRLATKSPNRNTMPTPPITPRGCAIGCNGHAAAIGRFHARTIHASGIHQARAHRSRPLQRPTKPAPVRASEGVKPKPSPSPARGCRPVHAAAAGEPSSGQYWQVVATARPDAEIIAEALGKKGFHVVLAPAPKDGIFRVLVGPLPDAATQAQTRTGLESAGFKNPIMRKY